MIRHADALALLLEHLPPRKIEEVVADHALGRVSAGELRCEARLPPFDNSAMDGFAVAAGGRTLAPGTLLEVVGGSAAGEAHGGIRSDGETGEDPDGGEPRAWEIMTGAPVPPGFDTVVPIEDVEVERDATGRPLRIRLGRELAPELNIRPAGSDLEAGDPLLAPGTRVGPFERMVLASAGIGRLAVAGSPGVAILGTGPELVDDAEAPLRPGEIRNSNGPFLRAALESVGARVVLARTLGDEEAPFMEALGEGRVAGASLVVSTGAVSMGKHDFVPGAVRAAGGRILFHRAAIRPGKPILGAVLPGGALFFGLPGNPVSTAAGFRFFVVPVLRALLGEPPEEPRRLPLAEEVRKRSGLRYFSRVRVEEGDEGRGMARLLPGQESYRVAPLLRADGWGVLPEEPEHLPAGTMIDVWSRLPPG